MLVDVVVRRRQGVKVDMSLALMIALVFGGNVASGEDRSPELVKLRTLLGTDPVTQAKSALARGDTRLLAVAGYTITVPGIDESSCSIPSGRIVVIPGTSDALLTEEHAQLNARAQVYAQRYNAEIQKRVGKQGCK